MPRHMRATAFVENEAGEVLLVKHCRAARGARVGEAQGAVDSRGCKGTGHTSGHGEEVHGGRESTLVPRSCPVGSIC